MVSHCVQPQSPPPPYSPPSAPSEPRNPQRGTLLSKMLKDEGKQLNRLLLQKRREFSKLAIYQQPSYVTAQQGNFPPSSPNSERANDDDIKLWGIEISLLSIISEESPQTNYNRRRALEKQQHGITSCAHRIAEINRDLTAQKKINEA
jgi:hypothetical protein